MDNAGTEFELRPYLETLRRRAWVIVLVIVITVGAAMAMSLTSSKVYSASSRVLITDPSQASLFDSTSNGSVDPTREVDTQIQLIESSSIADAANRKLGTHARLVSAVGASAVVGTDIVQISAQSTDPGVARDAANVYAGVYVQAQEKQAVDSLLAAGSAVQTILASTKAQLDGLDATLSETLAAPKPDQGAVENLQTQRDAVAAQYGLLQQKYGEVQADAALRNGGAQLVSAAELPTVPVKPRPLRTAVLALLLGLMLGTGLAFVLEHLDDSLKSTDDLDRFQKGLSCLAAIPTLSTGRNKRGNLPIVALDEPSSRPAEAYRALRTSVQIVGLRQPIQTLLVTSPASSEGKTTTLVNLGVTLARLGKRVALVDLDLRRPRIAEYLGLGNDVGFMSVLLGDAPLSEALQEVSIIPGGSLHVLGSGPLPPNPSEVLGTQRVAELLRSLQANVDFVLIDSPPLLPVTDALVLSRSVDGVIVVAWPRRTRRKQLSRALQMLHGADAAVVGVVLNGTALDADGYGYGYEADGDGTTKSKLPRSLRRESENGQHAESLQGTSG